MNSMLKNPIVSILRDINFTSILKQCQLDTLAISIKLFLKNLENILQSTEVVRRNKNLELAINVLRIHTKKQLSFMCKS